MIDEKWSIYDWGRYVQQHIHDRKVTSQIDGHYCFDWDELAVSAWTQEYDCCTDFPKSILGRVINRFCVWRFNLGWWWHVGRKREKQVGDDLP